MLEIDPYYLRSFLFFINNKINNMRKFSYNVLCF